MASGKIVYLAKPSPEQIRISDVVTHLSRINRYTGASTISVAQHSVVAARMARRYYPGHSLLPARMLIHDIAEHILGDIASPLKVLLGDYKTLEHHWDAAVERRFDLTFLDDPFVKVVDDRCYLTERLLVFPTVKWPESEGGLEPFPLDADELGELFGSWPVEVAEHEFSLELATELRWTK